MKVKILSDPFNITKRLKTLNKNYFIMFNTKTQKYELHNSQFNNTYCITIPFNSLDVRTINLVRQSEKTDEVIAEIENHNKKLQIQTKNKLKEKSEYQLNEIYNYANRHVCNYNGDAFLDVWV